MPLSELILYKATNYIRSILVPVSRSLWDKQREMIDIIWEKLDSEKAYPINTSSSADIMKFRLCDYITPEFEAVGSSGTDEWQEDRVELVKCFV